MGGWGLGRETPVQPYLGATEKTRGLEDETPATHLIHWPRDREVIPDLFLR